MPDLCKEILSQMNGCFIYKFSLFGLPESMYKNGTLDRKTLNQFDLRTANQHWIREYRLKSNYFHFGGRAYTDNENIGYFLDHDQIIYSIRTSGEILKTWTSLKEFLTDEIIEAEKMMREGLPKHLR
jgi:hypothetical protein